MNKVILTGRLTRDWERNDTSTILKNSIAVNGYKDKVDFINLTCFNEKAMDTIENYTHKGSKVAIEGRISVNKTQDGKTFTNVVVEHVEFLDSKKDNEKEVDPVDYINHLPQKETNNNGNDDGMLWE